MINISNKMTYEHLSKLRCFVGVLFGTFAAAGLLYSHNIALAPVVYKTSPKPVSDRNSADYMSKGEVSVNNNTEMVKKNSNILCATYSGRLGNIMFQFAAAYSIAKKRGLQIIIKNENPLTKIFNIKPFPINLVKRPRNYCSKLYGVTDKWHTSYDPDVVNKITGSKDARLDGYFQSWKYWTECENDIRKLFTFKPSILEKAKSRLRSVEHFGSPNHVTVGIHVRRGDYYIESKLVGRTVASDSYFINAMKFYRSKFKNVIFVVVSDEFKWCKNIMRNEKNVTFMEGNSPSVDLAILSLTNHTIASVGTFSWWGAWLANGTATYYYQLFKPGSPSAGNFKNHSVQDFVYPGWVPLS